ncbi:MAG: CDP-glycerol glycerophosphotransferase family protein [Oscillospiraceae bacterium]|nr:CDP-glycerol glycerophosphotransferase family protein [Oscillospiraceae bacterium]
MNRKLDGRSFNFKEKDYSRPVLYTLLVLIMINYMFVTVLMDDSFLMKPLRDVLLVLLALMCLYKGKFRRFAGMELITVFVLFCGLAFLRGDSLGLGSVYLRRYLFPLILFALLTQMDMEKDFTKVMRFVLIMFAVLSVWGVFQAYVLGDVFLMELGYPYQYAKHYDRFIIANSFYFGGFGIQRVVSTISNPNVFALILGSTLIFLFFNYSRFTRKKLAAIPFVLICIGYLLTVSRSNFLAMGRVGLLLVMPYIPHKKKVFIAAGALVVTLVVIGLIQGEGSLLYRLINWVRDSFRFSEDSAAGRLSRWTDALTGIGKNPLGVGFGHVGALAWDAGSRKPYFSCENSYFALMLDTGWLGAAAYLAFAGIQIRRMRRCVGIFREKGDYENEKLCASGVVIIVYFLVVFLFSNHVHDMEAMVISYFYVAMIQSVARKQLPEVMEYDPPQRNDIVSKLVRKVEMLVENVVMAFSSLLWKRDRRTVLFGAWFGEKFADNSRFLFQYLAENKQELKLEHVVWVTRNEAVRDMLCNMGYEAYMMDSPESAHYHKTAFMHVVCNATTDRNGTVPDIDIHYSFGAKRVNLWHGVGVVKGVGCASKEYQRRKEKHKLLYTVKEKLERIKLYRQFVIGTGGWGDFYFLSPTETDTKQFSQFSYIPKKNFIETQYPRTCPCVRLTPREQEVLDYMKRYDKVVMYLPTFRTGSNRFDFSNIAEQLEDILKQENILWVQKAHSASDTVLSQENQGHILNLEPAFDINVLMPHCDLLITDYSSAASDARFFRKPVLFYVPDLEEYTNGDNGITPEAEELMRGPQLFDMESLRASLIKTIREPESAKPADYEDIRLKYWGEDKDYRRIWKEICKAVGAKKQPRQRR